jgi:hypothetical protein
LRPYLRILRGSQTRADQWLFVEQPKTFTSHSISDRTLT